MCLTAHCPQSKEMDVALTVQDAKELQARELKLVHHKLQALPSDLSQLTHLTKLDASDNPIKDLTTCFLSQSLKELNLTGCQLTAVPQCLTSLTNLQHLQLSANQICNMDAIFQIPYLLHAGLAFNHVSSLHTSSQRHSLVAGTHPKAPCSSTDVQHSNRAPLITSSTTAAQKSVDNPSRRNSTPPASPGSKPGKTSTNSNHNSPKVSTAGYKDTAVSSTHQQPCSKCRSSVMSLDLSHNDITDLPAVLQQLQQLSQLKSLSLKGNPISLLPCYREAVLQQLPQLMYLDGQKLDGIVTTSNSRPSSSAASMYRPGSSRRPGSRPTSCKSTNSLTVTDPDQQQQGLTGAFADLLAPPDEVTVPLLLQLNTLQIVESAAKVFAGLLELSMKKQQEVLQQHVSQQQQQGADEGAGGPANSSHMGKETGVNPATSAVTAATATAGADGGGGGHASDLGRAEGSLAVDVSTSPAEIPVAALKPIIYHLQTIAPDGSEMCSTPLIIQPPAVAPDPAAIAAAEAAAATTATSAASPKKGKGSKAPKQPDKPAAAAAAAKSKASAKAVKGRSSADEGAVAAAVASQLADGCLKVMLQLPASVVGRDWLRQGFTVKLMRTHQQPETVEQQSPAAPQSATVTNTAITKNGRPNSGKGSSKPVTGAAGAMQGGSAASTSSISWQYSTQQQLLGTAKISAANLLEGDVQHEHLISEGTAEFMPEPSLYDTATGTLMLLKEAKAKLQPVGSCRYKLVLHHMKECSVE